MFVMFFHANMHTQKDQILDIKIFSVIASCQNFVTPDFFPEYFRSPEKLNSDNVGEADLLRTLEDFLARTKRVESCLLR